MGCGFPALVITSSVMGSSPVFIGSRLTPTTRPEASLDCRLSGFKTNDTVFAIKILTGRLMKYFGSLVAMIWRSGKRFCL